MTQQQAARLGAIIKRARKKHGYSTRDFSQLVGVPRPWLHDVEHGLYLEPAADRIAAIAEALSIKQSIIDRAAGGRMDANLPVPRAYFRAKYQLTPDQVAAVEHFIDEIRDGRGQP